MAAGFVLLWTGFVEQDESRAQKEYRLEWVCEPAAGGSATTTRCETQGPTNYSFNNGDENSGLSMSLAGVGLIAASASIAVGGRRGSARTGAVANPTPAYSPGAPPMPGPQQR